MTTQSGAAEEGHPNDQATEKVETPPAKEFKPIQTQEEFDKILGARIYEERNKYADYEELKTAKAELDKIKEADKTEVEKLTDRALTAEVEVAAYKKAAQEAQWRLEVRTEKELPESVDLLLTGETLQEIQAKAELLAANIQKNPRRPIIPGDTGDNYSKPDGKKERPKGQVFL